MSNLILIGAAEPMLEAPAEIKVRELEKGVGCDIDSYLLAPDRSLDARIASAKQQLGSKVVILGHHYQRDEVVNRIRVDNQTRRWARVALERMLELR